MTNALREAAGELDQAFYSHIDGRDLLEQLCPSGWHHCDIVVRIGGKDIHYEGDWLKDVWYARRKLQEALK